MSQGKQPRQLTQKEMIARLYIFRDARDEKNHRAFYEALEKIQDWDELPQEYFGLQDCVLFRLQQDIDSDGGIIDRVGSERPKQALYCRMNMLIVRLAIRKLQSTMKKPSDSDSDEEVEEENATEERGEVSEI